MTNKPPEKQGNRKIGMIGSFIVAAIAYIVLGIFMVTHSDSIINGINIVFGIVMLLYGIINIIVFFLNKDQEANLFMEMAIGVVAVALGIFSLLNEDLIVKIFFYTVGAVLIIDGLVNIKRAFSLKSMEFSRWYVLLISAAIGIILGALCIFLYMGMGQVIVIFVGIALIYEGIASLLTMLLVSRTKKKITKEIIRMEKDDRR